MVYISRTASQLNKKKVNGVVKGYGKESNFTEPILRVQNPFLEKEVCAPSNMCLSSNNFVKC